MELFDKIGEMVSQTYKKTAEKADKLSRETKLKIKLNEYKSRIDELYKEIGEAVYRIHISRKNDNSEEQIKISCYEIDKISDEIEKANQQLLKIRNKKQCQKCYEEIEITAKYCPKCGAEQEEKYQKEQEPQDQVIIKEGLIIESENREEKQRDSDSEENNKTNDKKD